MTLSCKLAAGGNPFGLAFLFRAEFSSNITLISCITLVEQSGLGEIKDQVAEAFEDATTVLDTCIFNGSPSTVSPALNTTEHASDDPPLTVLHSAE